MTHKFFSDQIFRETMIIVLSIIFLSGILVYFLRKQNYYFVTSWASIKSWLFAAPLLFFVFGFPTPIPLIGITLIAIYGAKAYFQIMGMYHKSIFVLLCYAGIYGLAFCAYKERIDIYNIMPLIFLGVACLIPLVLNKYQNMIQYISLSLLGFIFLGWSVMHLALMLKFPNGLYQIMYLIILTEFCDNTNLAIGHYFRGWRLFPGIDPKRKVGGTFVSIALTLILAKAMRELLPDGADQYWLVAGLIASLGGVLGDLMMTAIRRDAGVKIVGPFILGRGDFLQRMDRLIFVAPIYYYIMWL